MEKTSARLGEYEKDARGSTLQGAVRERDWVEIGLEEKVERLQRMCSDLCRVVNLQAQMITEAHRVAHSHAHGPHGQVMVYPDQSISPFGPTRVSDHPIR